MENMEQAMTIIAKQAENSLKKPENARFYLVLVLVLVILFCLIFGMIKKASAENEVVIPDGWNDRTDAQMATTQGNQLQKDNQLKGDKGLACEALMCLSTGGTRPSECRPSIKKYFSIVKRTASRTVRARKDFLKMCPDSKDVGNEYIDQMVAASGKCDADYLNAHNKMIIQVQVCDPADRFNCWMEDRQVVSNNLPKSCSTFINHEWTIAMNVRYVGSPENGGHWVYTGDN